MLQVQFCFYKYNEETSSTRSSCQTRATTHSKHRYPRFAIHHPSTCIRSVCQTKAPLTPPSRSPLDPIRTPVTALCQQSPPRHSGKYPSSFLLYLFVSNLTAHASQTMIPQIPTPQKCITLSQSRYLHTSHLKRREVIAFCVGAFLV